MSAKSIAQTRVSTETLVVLVTEQSDVDHGNDQVSADCEARKVHVFLRSRQTRAKFASLVSLLFFFHFVRSKRG